jgi:hypothetical protein
LLGFTGLSPQGESSQARCFDFGRESSLLG